MHKQIYVFFRKEKDYIKLKYGLKARACGCQLIIIG